MVLIVGAGVLACRFPAFAGEPSAGEPSIEEMFTAIQQWEARRETSHAGKRARKEARSFLRRGLVGYWTFDEGRGQTAGDSSGGRHHGTLRGNPAWTRGVAGGALDFDGVDDRVVLGTMDIHGPAGLTIALWFKADDFDVSDARFIAKTTGTAESNHYWMISTIGRTALRVRLKAGGSTITLASGTGQVVAGRWYHVALTYDGSKARIYKDGVQVAGADKTGRIDVNPTVGVAVGNQPPGAGTKAFDGLIDEVRIYSRALAAAELQALVRRSRPPKPRTPAR